MDAVPRLRLKTRLLIPVTIPVPAAVPLLLTAGSRPEALPLPAALAAILLTASALRSTLRCRRYRRCN